jgi:hypothetical protein
MLYFSTRTSEGIKLVVYGASAPKLEDVVEFVHPKTAETCRVCESLGWIQTPDPPADAIHATIVR